MEAILIVIIMTLSIIFLAVIAYSCLVVGARYDEKQKTITDRRS